MKGFIIALRVPYLLGGLMLYALGVVLGEGSPDALAVVFGTVVVVLVHAITHYVNDAEDVATDAQSDATLLTGGSRAIQRGLVTPDGLLRVSTWLSVLVVLVATVELARDDRVACGLHLAILALGYAYSGRPFMLGRRAMGELDGAVVMGVLVPLSGAHAGGGIGQAAWALCLVLSIETIFARLATAFPDIEADRATAKWTLPALVGARGTAIAFVIVAGLIVAAGVLAAPRLPLPPVQLGCAVAAAFAALAAAAAIVSGVATRRRLVVPALGVLGYGVTQAVLLATLLWALKLA